MKEEELLKKFLKLKMANEAPKKLSGHLEPFDPTNDDFENWISLFDVYCIHNGIDKDDKSKIEALVMNIGKESAMKINQAVQPDTVYKKSFADILNLCNLIFGITTTPVDLRINFMSTIQERDESVAVFGLKLQGLASRCKFHKDDLDLNLISKFIGGLCDKNLANDIKSLIISKILVDFKQTFEYAINKLKATSSTVSHINNRNWKPKNSSNNTSKKFQPNNNKHKWNKSKQFKKCTYCKKLGHNYDECYYAKNEKNKKFNKNNQNKFANKNGKIHQVGENQEESLGFFTNDNE